MASRVIDILKKHGPGLSSSLAQHLRAQGLSPEAARQSLSRLPEGARVLFGLPFPKRARFLFLDEHFGTDAFWSALIAAVNEASPAYSAALVALRSRNGIVPSKHFEIVSGSPVKQKGQISAASVAQRLLSVKLLSKLQIEGIGECFAVEGGGLNIGQLRARLLTEQVLLDGLRRWAVSLNMASAKQTKIRDDSPEPQFSTFRFDLCGPCYLRPLRRWKGKTLDAGFLVADVLLGSTLSEDHVSPFIRKCSTLGHLRNNRPFLPMLIADGFTPEALKICRSEGIIATRPESIFGEDVGKALSELLQTLSNAAAISASSPERIEKLFSSLAKIEGSAGNLRGALFEVIVGHLVRSREGGSIDIGEIVLDTETGRRAEIDIRLVKERDVAIYECKGYQSSATVSAREVDEWITKRIPIIANAHRQQQRFDGGTLRFEFWTCGGFEPEAMQLINEAKERTKKYQIAWKDGQAISDYAKHIAAPGIRKILSEHYFAHPTVKLASQNSSPSKPKSALTEIDYTPVL
jgi:hypothetical protein